MYVNTSATPNLGPRTFSFQANDGHTANNLSNVVSRMINIVNGVPPTFHVPLISVFTYTEKNPPPFIAPQITINDSDSVDMTKAIIQISGNYTAGQDRLAFTNSAGVTAAFDSTTGTLTLTGAESLTAYQTMLESVVYQNVSNNPSTLMRTVSITVVDDTGERQHSLYSKLQRRGGK